MSFNVWITITDGWMVNQSHLLHLLLELSEVEVFVLRLAGLRLAELAEELEVFLAFIAGLEDGKVLQCLVYKARIES